jgi:hypothetical protein
MTTQPTAWEEEMKRDTNRHFPRPPARQHAPYRDFVVSTGARSPRFSFQRMQQYISAPDRTQRR